MIKITTFLHVFGKTVDDEITEEQISAILRESEDYNWEMPWDFSGVKFTDGTGLLIRATNDGVFYGSENTPPDPWYVQMFFIAKEELE